MMKVTEYTAGNIQARGPFLLNKGEKNEGHVHHFDHLTFVNRGSFSVHRWKGNQEETTIVSAIDGRSQILIEKDWCHELTALEDGSIYYCLYAHRTPQGEVVQHYTGWEKAYR